MSCARAALPPRNAARNASAVKVPSRIPRPRFTLSARERQAAARAAAREHSVSPSPAPFCLQAFASEAWSAPEQALPAERGACAGLRVAQCRSRPNRRRHQRQRRAVDPWRQVDGGNSILRSRWGLFRGCAKVLVFCPFMSTVRAIVCGDFSSSFYPPLSPAAAAVSRDLLVRRLSTHEIPTIPGRSIQHSLLMCRQDAPLHTYSTD